MGIEPSEDVVCFDGFELAVRTAELHNPEGRTVRLSEQPLRILIALLERPGDLVLREDLRMRLWPTDTVVEFEHSTNAAVNRLRQALSDSAENPKFIETLARRGYRWKTPVQWKKPLAIPAPSGLPDVRCEPATGLRADLKQVKDYSESGKIAVKPTSPDEASEHRKLRAVLAVCIATGILAAAGTWYLRYGNKAQIDSIAVLPFINESGDANIDYLSDGIAESVTDSLTQIPQLKVKSRRSAFQFKGKNVSLQKVGNELGVSLLVSGRVVPHGDNIEVNAELTDVRDNTEIWAQHYSGKRTEVVSLQQQIAGDIAEKLRSKLSTPEKRRVTSQGTQSPEAHELYLTGVTTGTNSLFQTLPISSKPSPTLLAYSGLADAYSQLPVYGIRQAERTNLASIRNLPTDTADTFFRAELQRIGETIETAAEDLIRL